MNYLHKSNFISFYRFILISSLSYYLDEVKMAEELLIGKGRKSEKYEALIPQVRALIMNESDNIANMANIAAALKQTFDFFWVGFYIVHDTELVLGPFQGPIACTRIKKGKGVCGTAWDKQETIVVPDVDKFPGHIAWWVCWMWIATSLMTLPLKMYSIWSRLSVC